MVDYRTRTGSGYLYIRDTGHSVEFYIQAAFAATYINSASWSGWVNGTAVGGGFAYPTGAPFLHIASYPVTTTQDVRFSIAATRTSGLGGPTDFWLHISRVTVPPAPIALSLDEIGFTSMQFRFSGNGLGGGAFLNWEASIADNPGFSNERIVTTSGTNTFQNLTPGLTYWARGRGVNVYGGGPWSNVLSATTLSGGKMKVDGVLRPFVPYVKLGGVVRPAVPYLKSGGVVKPSSG